MTLLKHELRQSRISLAVWTASIAGLILVCVFLFPEMKGEMDGMSEMFASMGSFTAAFGMDRLNFGTLIGFYAVECGNILGLGGAFFASLTAVSVPYRYLVNLDILDSLNLNFHQSLHVVSYDKSDCAVCVSACGTNQLLHTCRLLHQDFLSTLCLCFHLSK